MSSAKLQPALFGGAAIGVLTALPVVNLVNFCCCAWVVGGGALAVYLMQQNQPDAVNTGDSAVVGLMAGVFGAIIGTLIAIPIAMAMGPFQAQMIERVLQGTRDLPPEVRAIFEQMRGSMGGAMFGVGMIVTTLISLCVYSVFGLLGGLLGSVMFRKHSAPPPIPTQD